MRDIDFSNHLFRASQIGKLMVNNRAEPTEKQMEKIEWLKNKEKRTDKQTDELKRLERKRDKWNDMEAIDRLPATTITHLVDVYVSTVFDRQSDVFTKAIEKGLAVEEDSITLLSRITGKYYKKNEDHFNNDYLKGTPDIVSNGYVRDVKSNWDIFSFFRTQDDKLNSDYYWQLQTYMELTGTKKGYLDYCLVNTPDSIIIDEQRRLFWKGNYKDETDIAYIKDCEQLEKNIRYDDIDKHLRLNTIEIEYNEHNIKRLYERIKDCRVWLNNYHKQQLQKLKVGVSLN